MPRFRTQGLAVVLGLALMALLPTTAFASSTANESISGVETGIPVACGTGYSLSTFAGVANGTINGVWSASVCHTDLSTTDGTATVSGGAFHMSGLVGWRYVRTSGTFDPGSIAPGVETDHIVKGVGTCTQVFGLNLAGSGSSWFMATLVHYGAYFAGSCHVFSATLRGNAHITY